MFVEHEAYHLSPGGFRNGNHGPRVRTPTNPTNVAPQPVIPYDYPQSIGIAVAVGRLTVFAAPIARP